MGECMSKMPGAHDMFNFESATSLLWSRTRRALAALLAAVLLSPVVAYAADTQCAKVKMK